MEAVYFPGTSLNIYQTTWLHIPEDSKDSYVTTMATTGVCNTHFVSGLDPVLPISTFISNGADFKPVFCNIVKNSTNKFRAIYTQIMLKITTFKFKRDNTEEIKYWNIWSNEL
jgi:hypothetical protein